jgi:hypothetical protein
MLYALVPRFVGIAEDSLNRYGWSRFCKSYLADLDDGQRFKYRSVSPGHVLFKALEAVACLRLFPGPKIASLCSSSQRIT